MVLTWLCCCCHRVSTMIRLIGVVINICVCMTLPYFFACSLDLVEIIQRLGRSNVLALTVFFDWLDLLGFHFETKIICFLTIIAVLLMLGNKVMVWATHTLKIIIFLLLNYQAVCIAAHKQTSLLKIENCASSPWYVWANYLSIWPKCTRYWFIYS